MYILKNILSTDLHSNYDIFVPQNFLVAHVRVRYICDNIIWLTCIFSMLGYQKWLTGMNGVTYIADHLNFALFPRVCWSATQDHHSVFSIHNNLRLKLLRENYPSEKLLLHSLVLPRHVLSNFKSLFLLLIKILRDLLNPALKFPFRR